MTKLMKNSPRAYFPLQLNKGAVGVGEAKGFVVKLGLGSLERKENV